ncbi:MAG: acyl-CoA ligase (AMP-forming), exosortase A system-associated [Gammaproteobacteria bacterium]|jgi:acyl-CoA ligase (AMP-forming) (exosortase A-associated)|nr:acyl-CoA ligase (AMP-forming), exosortase A system-associated [Gammaproteobacteria bacterium]
MLNQKIRLLHELVAHRALSHPDALALLHKDDTLTFSQLQSRVESVASGLVALGLNPDDRVAIYLPKQFETVIGFFAAAAAGGVSVPVNPMLKPQQVGHILRDCNVRVLITSAQRLKQLESVIQGCPDLEAIILTTERKPDAPELATRLLGWDDVQGDGSAACHERIDVDMAAILYTSGSTGSPKGVVLSHANMVAAAESSAEFLRLSQADRLLAVLPLSFDYGLSQLTTAYFVGASVVLMDFLLAKEVVAAVARYSITGISAVPPIWNQLAILDWPPEAVASMRYLTTSGGAAQRSTLLRLKEALPSTGIYQMYGLTEAFRSSYLPPEEFDRRPGSVGKALPNVELMVVRPDGSRCDPDEPGELVHRGSLVAMGYWNDPQRTAQRFREAPGQPQGIPLREMAVWSGDQMRMDAEGYLYFESRQDEMIKTSGYRVSPTEVEEVVFASGLVTEAVAVGVTHPELGQAIVLLVETGADADVEVAAILKYCQKELPSFMVPAHIEIAADLPRNPNGKIDRPNLRARYSDFFTRESSQ